MATKGLFLSTMPQGSNLIYVYLCVFDMSLFSASLSNLLPSSAAKSSIEALETVIDTLQPIGTDAPDSIIDIIDEVEGLMSVGEAGGKFPRTITDPTIVDYSSFFQQSPITNQRTGVYKLQFCDFRPQYKILAGQSGITASIAYTGWIRGIYKLVNTTTTPPPPVFGDALPFVVGGLKALLPSNEDTYLEQSYNVSTWYVSTARSYSYADLRHVSAWYESPPYEGHFFNPRTDTADITLLLSLQSYGICPQLSCYVPYDSPYSLSKGHTPTYPETLPVGYSRYEINQGRYCDLVSREDYNLMTPGYDGLLIPLADGCSIGVVLAGVLGVASETNLLESVWRRRKNG